VSWNDSSYEDAAEGENGGGANGYELTPEQAAEIMADPELAPSEATLPAAIAGALDQATSSPTDGTVPALP